MNQLEATLIAKTLRNITELPIGYKQDVIKRFLPLLRERVPFFNEKQFISVASDTLPEGWPNRTDK